MRAGNFSSSKDIFLSAEMDLLVLFEGNPVASFHHVTNEVGRVSGFLVVISQGKMVGLSWKTLHFEPCIDRCFILLRKL